MCIDVINIIYTYIMLHNKKPTYLMTVYCLRGAASNGLSYLKQQFREEIKLMCLCVCVYVSANEFLPLTFYLQTYMKPIFVPKTYVRDMYRHIDIPHAMDAIN
jgi:hypothetical protein